MTAMSAPVPEKVRPSWWWFVLGGGLLVAAAASGVGLFVWTLSGFLSTEATVAADGGAQVVEVGTDGERMLWVDERYAEPDCSLVDTATGEPVSDLRETTGDFRRSSGAAEWYGAYVFEPGSGRIEVTCVGADEVEVQIGPAPSLGGFGLGVLLTIAVPLVLGGLGLVVLLVTGILWSTRATTRR